MRRRFSGLVAIVALGMAGASCGSSPAEPAVPADIADRARAAYGNLPLTFEPNVGQAAQGVGFVARGHGYSLTLGPTEAALALAGPLGAAPATLGLTFVGADPGARPRGFQPTPGRVNYLVGDRRNHRTGVPTFARVVYEDVYDGIDVAYYGRGMDLEYDFVVAPGADHSRVRVAFSGAGGIRLDGDGDLVLDVGGASVTQQAPVAYQDVGGRRRPVEAGYALHDGGEVGLRLGDHDRRLPVVVDPVIVYSTYLGGEWSDAAADVEVDASGSAYIVGHTRSTDFPTRNSLYPSRRLDAVVVKLNPAGSALVYSTFLGGSDNDNGSGVAVDSSGAAHVSGTTASDDFPTRAPWQGKSAGEQDAFVAKLGPSGSTLAYSTYLGGGGEDYGADVDVDGAGNAVVTGGTESANFPTRTPVQGSRRGYSDAFVAKLDPTGSLLYSTYLGGTGYATPGYYSREGGYAIAADGAGNAYVTGLTETTDFPVVNALFPVSGNGYDAFITKLAPTGSFVYSTYLGSPGSESPGDIDVDTSGSVYITGNVAGGMPEKDPLQPAMEVHDAFVTKLDPAGSALEFSTNLGGQGNEYGNGIAVDGTGAVYVVGETARNPLDPGRDFPLKDPLQATRHGFSDMFVTKIALGASTRPTIEGATFFTDGTSARSAAPGTSVSLFANSAATGFAYRVVLARDGCATTVAVLGTAPRYVNAGGFIGSTRVTIPAGTPAGRYELCFKSDGGLAASGPATITVG